MVVVVLLVGSQPARLEVNIVVDSQHLQVTETLNNTQEGVEEVVILQGGDEKGQGDVVPWGEENNAASLAGLLLLYQSLYKAL